MADASDLPRREVARILRHLGVVADGRPGPVLHRLASHGEVEAWRVDRADGPLRVVRGRPGPPEPPQGAAGWTGDEAAFLDAVAPVVAGHVPRVVAHDRGADLLVLSGADPPGHRPWSVALAREEREPSTAEVVGRLLVAVHAATVDDTTVAGRFADPARFTVRRLAPALDRLAERHPDLAGALRALRQEQLAHRRVLIHGDVRPEHVLVGVGRPDAPPALVLVGADCPALADPAWDLATLVAHLLLAGPARRLHAPAAVPPADEGPGEAAREAVAHLGAAYLTGVTWEPLAAVEARAAALVPALLLAALDPGPAAGGPDDAGPAASRADDADNAASGPHDAGRAPLVAAARALVARPPRRLGELVAAWPRPGHPD